MFQNLIRLLVVSVLLYAGIKVTPVFWNHVKFEDAVAETAKFSSRRPEVEVRKRVLALATSHGVALAPESLWVTKVNDVTVIELAYSVDLEYFPKRTYPWDFFIRVEGEPPAYGDLIP